MRQFQPNGFKRKTLTLIFRVLLLVAAIDLTTISVEGNDHDQADNRVTGIRGRIADSDGKPVQGVIVSLKGRAASAVSDENGEFTIETSETKGMAVFCKTGYKTKEQAYPGKKNLFVTLMPERYVDVLWGRIKADHLTDAVSYISGDELKSLPGINRKNVLGGRLTGLTVQQSDGEPGLESSSVYIRGLRTLGGAQQTPYILVDGYWRNDAAYINPNDIESITVLKDAASTAIYGLRGGNGIMLITTKRGKDEPIKVSLDAKYGLQTPTRIPKYLDSYLFAQLYNEALHNQGREAKYDESALDAYRTGTDPYHYPNIDWAKEFLKDYSAQQDYNLSIRGGNKSVRYYASAGYVKNTGLYNVDDTINTYDTNLDFEMYRLRSNIDVQVTKSLHVSMEIGGRQEKRNYPGLRSNSSDRIFTVLYQLPPNAFPIFNEDRSLAGTSQYTNNPYGLLNYSGYSIYNVRNTDAAFKAKYDMSDFVKGLSIRGSVSFDSYFEQTISRNKGFVVYEGSLEKEWGEKDPETQQNSSSVGDNQRIFDIQAGFDYSREFGKHALSGTLFAEQTSFAGDGSVMPHYYRGIMGRASYAFHNRYLAQVSFAYQGSEQTSDQKRYILFPAVSAGWVLSEESFLKGSSLVNFLKIRASHGLTGNDSNIGYFQKLSFFEKSGSYLIGDNLASYSGYREGAPPRESGHNQ